MKRFVTGQARDQATLFPERLDDFIGEDNPIRVVDLFVDALDLRELGFERVDPAATGRPSYQPAVLLKLYIYGYLYRVQSSRRLEREMLAPDDQQISLTDPDARAMKGRGAAVVAYNVQTPVEPEHHLIVAHEVTNSGSD